jgi:GntR family transcriptional regulator
VFRVSPQSGVPLYLQLVEQVRHAIELGALVPGDQLPGIRKLAADLVMNPNTVAKAYREMEHAGLIELRHGAGAFVTAGEVGARKAIQEGRLLIDGTVSSLRQLGLDDGAIRRLVESALATAPEEKKE